MNDAVFSFEMQRLNENFKNFYSKSKIKIVRNIVDELPDYYFSKCVEQALWADRPPKIEWFHETVSKFRKKERAYAGLDEMEREKNSVVDDKSFSMMKEYSLLRMEGRLGEKDYHDFQKTLREYISASRPDIECKICLDQGQYLPYMKSNLENCSRGCAETKLL